MRTFGSFIFGVIATVAIIAAIPLWWAQQNLVDADGYAKLTSNLAQEADLRSAIGDNLVVHADEVIADKAKDIPASQADKVKALKDKIAKSANAYVSGPDFAKTFGAANDSVHEQLLGGTGTVTVDLAPFAQQAFAKIDDPLAKDIPAAIAKQDLSVNLAPASGSSILTAMPLITPAAQLAAGTAGVATLLALLLGRRRGSVLVWLGIFTALATGVSMAITKFGAGVLAGGGEGLVGSLRSLLVTGVTESMAGWQRWALIASGAAIVVGIVWLVATRNRRRDEDDYDSYYDDAQPAGDYPDAGYRQQGAPARGEAYQEAGYAEPAYSPGGYAEPGYPQAAYPGTGSTPAVYADEPYGNGGGQGGHEEQPLYDAQLDDQSGLTGQNGQATRGRYAADARQGGQAADRPFPSRRELRNAERARDGSASAGRGAPGVEYDENGYPKGTWPQQ